MRVCKSRVVQSAAKAAGCSSVCRTRITRSSCSFRPGMRRCPTTVGWASAASCPVSTVLANTSACSARQRSLVAASFSCNSGRFSSRRPTPKWRASLEQVSLRRMQSPWRSPRVYLFGERRLVIPAQDRVTCVALIQHGLQLALVATVDPPPKQVGGALGAAHQHAEFAGAPEQGLERRRALEDNVCCQLHLGHAVAIARRQGRALSRAEGGHQATYPVGTASL